MLFILRAGLWFEGLAPILTVGNNTELGRPPLLQVSHLEFGPFSRPYSAKLCRNNTRRKTPMQRFPSLSGIHLGIAICICEWKSRSGNKETLSDDCPSLKGLVPSVVFVECFHGC